MSITFDGNPAPILYASSSQINVAVPFAVGGQNSTVMQVTVNGVASPPRELPLRPMVVGSCSGRGLETAVFVPLALGQDGTPNSCQHPGKPGDVVSFFLNGIGGQPRGNNTYGPYFGSSIEVVAQIGSWFSVEFLINSEIGPIPVGPIGIGRSAHHSECPRT